MDLTRAFENVCFDSIKYLKNLGYTQEQRCLLLSAAPSYAPFATVIDACASLSVPTAMLIGMS